MLHSSDGPRPSTKKLRSSRRKPHKGSAGACPMLAKVSKKDCDRIIFDYLSALGSPRALTVWLLYSQGSHSELVKLACDPLWYDLDPEKFRLDYAATKFLSKCVGLNTGIDLKEVALASAEEAELHCQETNKRLRRLRRFPGVNPALHGNFFRAQRIIADILGPLPDSFEDVGWSRGRTSAAFGDEVASIYKYASRPDVTVSALGLASRLVRGSPLWGASVLNADGPASVLQSAFTIVEGNTLITVPKSAKTDRVICYEPHMNIRLQLAVGSYIRRRLLKRGINLNDQSINQRRAREGSLSGDLATIDLSMASDTLALELVYELLPIDWALALDQLRSRYTLWPDGSNRRNEKFSSMGNGFTFELESLIFYALASAVSENVSVFGDDIIMPTANFEKVSNLLEQSGFLVNTTKSYGTSYFRESCGGDYFCGLVCTPVYLRRLPKAREDVVKLHNATRHWCSGVLRPPYYWCMLLRRWRDVHTNHLGPSGYGDGHYHVDFEDCTPRRADFELDGWWFKTFVLVSRVNRLYGDRVSGHFPDGFGYAACCVSLGPRSVRSVFDASTDRRQFHYKQARVLANFTWPTVVWGS